MNTTPKPEEKATHAPVANTVTPAELVRQIQQRRVRRPVFLTATIGLAAALITVFSIHPSLSHAPDWQQVSRPWVLILAGTVLASVIVWRRWRMTPEQVARELDRQWSSKNRLEAATELVDETSPLAAAQHAEAAIFLSQAPKPKFCTDLLFLALVTVLLLMHVGTATVWIVETPKTPEPPASKVPKSAPTASIKWKSSKAEMKASSVEEVPLVAEAESSSGLQNLQLLVSINGEQAKPFPLKVDKLNKPGAVTIKTSIQLDELGVEPFDMVAYYLQAERIYSEKLPPTVSAIQFIQVRPFRDDADLLPPGGFPSKGEGDLLEMLKKLKIAQLLLMKQNFVLTHAEIDHTSSDFKEENGRVGKEQNVLAGKTVEVKDFASRLPIPPMVVDQLAKTEPLMREASEKILKVKNIEALPPQGKALSAITAIEKVIRKRIGLESLPGQPKPKVRDPFEEQQKFTLKKRPETDAGTLELWLEKQSKLVDDLKKPSQDSSNQKKDQPEQKEQTRQNGQPGQTPAERQTAARENGQQSGTAPNGTQLSGQPGQDEPGGGDRSNPGQNGPDAGDQTGSSGDGKEPGRSKPGETGSLAQRQDTIREGLSKLSGKFEDDVNQLVRSAAGFAGVSGQQLEARDNKAALEPASQALSDLKKAVALMNNRGRDQSKQSLAQAQDQLNDAAAKERGLRGQTGSGAADEQRKMAEGLQQLKEALQKEAEKQQATGSGVGAQALAKLATGLNDPALRKNLQALTQNPGDATASDAVAKKLSELAGNSAVGQAGLERDPSKALQEAIARLESGRATLERLEQRGGQGAGDGPGQGPRRSQNPDDQKSGQSGPDPLQVNGPSGNKSDRQVGTNGGNDASKMDDKTASGGGNGPRSRKGSGLAEKDVLEQMTNDIQRASAMTPVPMVMDRANELLRNIEKRAAEPSEANVVLPLKDIAGPAKELIALLKQSLEGITREETLREADIDDAPVRYRDAVSNYLESLSLDYRKKSEPPAVEPAATAGQR